MKQIIHPFRRLILPMLLILSLLVMPSPALAQPVITGVQPGMVSGSSPVDLVVTGSGFEEASVVVLENYSALETTFVSEGVLRATLPGGLPSGKYTIRVINSDNTFAFLTDALTVAEVTPTPSSIFRPLVALDSYTIGAESVAANQSVELVVKLNNAGPRMAFNIVVTITPGDFIPRVTGGVSVINELDPGENHRVKQPLIATYDIVNKTNATIAMEVAYTDETGTPYTETFNLTIPVTRPSGTASTATPSPTPTAAPILRPQLVISGYQTDIAALQPGFQFHLDLQASNVGNVTARRVTMILGGGSGSSPGPSGTPEPGGVSGGSGDFGNFAPVAASNVQFLGDLPAGRSTEIEAALIVNASTNPGAYPMKISFTYTGEDGKTFTDDQVITLLVFSPPLVEVNFYRDPGPLFAGQPNVLPLQVVNLGRKSNILGNMKVSGEGAQFTNNTILVGALDPGGYFTLDANVIPDQPGLLDLTVNIDYTDDFNQPQTITKTVQVEVQEAPVFEPGTEGGIPGEGAPPPVEQPETFTQKVVRFIKGMIGLDSSRSTPSQGEFPPGEMPPGEAEPGVRSVPIVPGKG
jgi:hypothetical protein